MLRILLCWKEQDSTLSLTEIAQRTSLTLPTAHRMIKALQREGFLVHDKISGNYALGPTILDLARVLLQRSDQDELVVTVDPASRAHAGDHRRDRRPPHSRWETSGCAWQSSSAAGRSGPPRGSDERSRCRGVPRGRSSPRGPRSAWRWSSASSSFAESTTNELHDRLAQVRENRYAISEGETIPGASALAFPLFGPNKDVRAAVNITGPGQSMDAQGDDVAPPGADGGDRLRLRAARIPPLTVAWQRNVARRGSATAPSARRRRRRPRGARRGWSRLRQPRRCSESPAL